MGFFGWLFGGGERAQPDVPAVLPESWANARGPRRSWVIGCGVTGAVLFEAGPKEIVVVVLPVADRAVFGDIAKLAPLAKRMNVRRVIVCNAGNDGHLAGSAVARACGLAHAYAIDATRPIDRGGTASDEKAVEVRSLVPLRDTALYVEQRGTAVHGTWSDGATFLCGHPMSFRDLAESLPDHAVGKLELEGMNDPKIVDVFLDMKQLIIPANVPGFYAPRLAKALSRMGVGSTTVNSDAPGGDTGSGGAPAAEPAPVVESRRLRVLAHMAMNELDAADALAVEAIAAGDETVDMHHQRAVIALMRGDEASAVEHMSKIDTPQAQCSRAIIAARRGDANAMTLSLAALGRLPGDVIAIRAAIIIHALAGDRVMARTILEEQREHLDEEVAGALEHAIDDPPRDFGHCFPEHASLVFQAVKPMIDRGDYAKAEPLLRRAAKWDPENLEIVGDLGFVLSKMQRDDEAIAVYDAAIARGGARHLLRFNRGNCQLRRLSFEAAAADFRACVEIKPDWHDARVNLVSALFAAGDKARAGAEIAQLKQLGGPPNFVTSLEQMLLRAP